MLPGRLPTPRIEHSIPRGTAAAVALSLCLCGSAAGQLDERLFPRPSNLRSAIGFWTDVYSRYTSDEVVIHDDLHLDVVYGVVSMSDLPQAEAEKSEAVRRQRRERSEAARDRIATALRSLSRGRREDVAPELLRVLDDAWTSGASRESLARAAERVRSQTGLRDRFAEAVVVSGRYLPGIEQAFAEEGVPLALSRLPFVESMFHFSARSKVGAVGAWQFMPATARLYLPMSAAVDSRFDPILAAHGAAKMLRADFESLQSWPLAITAYNHGRGGMSRAVRQVGSWDIGEIVAGYRSRTFGFASRNFYAEFLAAHDVYERRRELFPEVAPDPELRFDEVRLGHYVSATDVATGAGVSVAAIQSLNPALDPEVFEDRLLIPDDYPLRLPPGSAERTVSAVSRLPEDRRHRSQMLAVYRVRRGDTLSSIAQRFRIQPIDVIRLNQLSRPDRIFIGQTLRLPTAPGSGGGVTALASITAREGTVHTVRPGETLTSIAARYGRRIETLRQANGLRSADHILVGQRLEIPSVSVAASDRGPVRHVVRWGETLGRIAERYGVTIGAIQQHNGLRSSRIYSGQTLAIP